jgi:hypothetical protein
MSLCTFLLVAVPIGEAKSISARDTEMSQQDFDLKAARIFRNPDLVG